MPLRRRGWTPVFPMRTCATQNEVGRIPFPFKRDTSLRMSRKSRSLRPVPHERSVNSAGKPVPTVAGGGGGGRGSRDRAFRGKGSAILPFLRANAQHRTTIFGVNPFGLRKVSDRPFNNQSSQPLPSRKTTVISGFAPLLGAAPQAA